MNYVAQENRAFYLLPIFGVVLIQLSNSWSWSTFMMIWILGCLSLPVFIRHKVRFGFGLIVYEVTYFKWSLYRRVVLPEDIKEIHFKRYDWKKKGAVIQTKKGMNLRFVHFEPTCLMNKLESFAKLHHIEMKKTKDYQLIERMDKTQKET